MDAITARSVTDTFCCRESEASFPRMAGRYVTQQPSILGAGIRCRCDTVGYLNGLAPVVAETLNQSVPDSTSELFGTARCRSPTHGRQDRRAALDECRPRDEVLQPLYRPCPGACYYSVIPITSANSSTDRKS